MPVDDQNSADLSRHAWQLLVRRFWERPQRGNDLAELVATTVRETVAAGLSESRCQLIATELLHRARAGLPQPHSEFASEPTDFLFGGEGAFEPIDHPGGTNPFPGMTESEARLWLQQTAERSGAAWDQVSGQAESELLAENQMLLASVLAEPMQMILDLSRQEHRTRRPSEFFARDRAGVPGQAAVMYPALTPLLTAIGRNQIDATSLLLHRVASDRLVLNRELGVSESARVQSVRQHFSDRHSGGRSVARLRFDDGSTVYYKPRSVGLELGWNRLVQWLNDHGLQPALRPLVVVPREGYGWMEAVSAQACLTSDQVDAWFQKAGALVLLGWILGATDWHRENVIASGPDPLVIDMETLFSGGADELPGLDSLSFLPQRERAPFPIDVSGLGGGERQATSRRVPCWHRDAAGWPELTWQPAALRAAQNRVRIGTQTQSPGGHQAQVCDGYRVMSEHISRLRSKLAGANSPLKSMTREPRRTIVRSTRRYYVALNQSLQLRHLSSLEARFEAMLRALPDASKSELAALLHLDIPRIQTTDAASAWRMCQRRLGALDQTRAREHLSEIRRSVSTLTRAGDAS